MKVKETIMGGRFSRSMTTVAIAAAAVSALTSVSITRTSGQAPAAPAARPARVGGKPNFSGIWQANNEANWDLQAHAALPAAVTQPGIYPYDYARVPAAPVLALGAAAAVPGSLGVVQGDGQMPYPFQITQSTDKIHMAYEFSNTARTIHLDKVAGPPDDTWMGHSVGRWDGDTLVVDVTNFNDRSWFDRAGNFHSDALHLVERFTPMSPDIVQYEVTIEDPNVFTRPWRIAMPLYRRVEPNMQLLEFRCNEFVEEFMYGHLRKEPLVKHWESETMTVDITRKVPAGDRFYQWYGR